MQKTIRALFCAVVFALALTGAGQTQQLNIAQAYAVGEAALNAGEYETPRDIARALLQRDPDDFRALLMLAAAELGLGDNDAAALAAQRAFAVAQTDRERLVAARLSASALYRAGRFTGAQWWLRRALNNAKTVSDERAVRQDYAKVRADNPFSAEFSFSIAPNNNINNGSANETLVIWGLPFVLSADARALAGTEIAAGVTLGYRISRGPSHETSLGLQLFKRTYALSDAAKKAAPDVRGEDYAFAVAELSLRHGQKFPFLGGPTNVTLATGKNWYGGDPYTRYHRLSLQQVFPLGPNTSVEAGGGFEWQKDWQDGDATSRLYNANLALTQRLPNGDVATVSLRRANTWSDNDLNEYTGQRLGLRYMIGRPVLGTRVGLSYGVERRDYPLSIYDPEGRNDLTLTAGVDILFANISQFGFSPTFGIEASRTMSNVNLYDRESLAFRLGIENRF